MLQGLGTREKTGDHLCDNFSNQPIQCWEGKVQDQERRDGKHNRDKNVKGQYGRTGRNCIQDYENEYDNQWELGRQLSKENQGLTNG